MSVIFSENLWAAPITATVIIGTQEWAQVDLFTSVSWNTLNTQCPGGVCKLTSSINGYALDGWTWASTDVVQKLFNTFTGQATPAPGSYNEVASSWAPAFFALFNPTASSATYQRAMGWTSNPPPWAELRYAPEMLNMVPPEYADYAVVFKAIGMTAIEPYTGAWMVRDAAEVPTPATLTLFGLGLASVWISRRKLAPKA